MAFNIRRAIEIYEAMPRTAPRFEVGEKVPGFSSLRKRKRGKYMIWQGWDEGDHERGYSYAYIVDNNACVIEAIKWPAGCDPDDLVLQHKDTKNLLDY